MKKLILKCYKEDEYREVLVNKNIPDWFYSNSSKEYSDWNLIELNSNQKESVLIKIKDFEESYSLIFPIELTEFVTSYWKEEITIVREDVEYVLFRTLPEKELDEFLSSMVFYKEHGTLENSIPFGVDEFGNWILVNNYDDSVWVEDTDLMENIKISNSISDLLSGNTSRF